MAEYIGTGTMADPRYISRDLDHLGLVGGIDDELGMGGAIDRTTPQDNGKRIVSVGLAIKAMVLNRLGFGNQHPYRGPQVFQDKPTDQRIRAGIRSKQPESVF